MPDLNTNRVFTNGNSGAPYQSGMLRTTSSVTATGAQTLTLSGQTEIYNGPGGFILFFDGEIEVIDGDANSVGDTGSAGITLDSEAGATILVLDSNLDTTTPPSTPGGWTELETIGNNSLSATLRMKTSAGSSESITSTSPNYETLIAYAIRGGAGSTWTDVSGATTTTLSLTGVTLSDSGRKFRGVLTSAVGSTTTNEVTLTVTDGKLIPVSFTTAPPESPTSTNTKTALAPSGVQAGDMEVICCGVGAIAPAAAPTINDTTSGWSRVAHSDGTHQIGEGVFNLRMAVFMREATGAAADAVLTSSANGYWGWHRFALRNANADFLARVIFDATSQSTLPVLPGYTPEKSNTLRIDWMALGALAAISPASGMTEWSENTDHALGLYYQQIEDTNPTGTRTYGFSPASDAGTITLELHSLVSEADGGATDLVVADATHAHALEAVTLTLDAHLAPADLQHAHALDAVTLSTDVALAPAGLNHSHSLDAVVLSTATVVSLVVADLLHDHALDAASLTLDTHLAPADLAHAHALDAAPITVDSVIFPADLGHAQTLDAVTLDTTTGVDLEPDDLAHVQALDAVALTLDTTLALADLAHSHALDAAPLGLDTYLAVAELLHDHALEAVSLSTEDSIWLAPADLSHAHALEAVPLAADSWLAVADLTHAHALEAVTLATLLTLQPADLSHAHALEAVTLSDVPWLAVADLAHGHALDAVVLTSASTLTVADLFHLHRMDEPALTSDGDVYEFDPLFTAQPIRRGWTAEAVERAWDASPVARIWRAS